MTFQAFSDDCSSYTLGNLTFENNADRLSVYGDMQIQRDQQGLQQLLVLQSLINQAIMALQADVALPEQLPAAKHTEVDNPFLP